MKARAVCAWVAAISIVITFALGPAARARTIAPYPMFVPSSTMRFGARAATVMARNEATSGSLIGFPRSAASASIFASSESRGGSSASR